MQAVEEDRREVPIIFHRQYSANGQKRVCLSEDYSDRNIHGAINPAVIVIN